MFKDGINTYTTQQYTKLALDKYIESNRALDRIAGKLVNYEPALIFLGNGETPPNSPIKIKKNVRCPGSRKLLNAFKKRGDCTVLPVDEYFTSQTCAKCFGRFDPRTKNHKFKVCQDCRPDRGAMLPSRIVTELGRRELQAYRKMDRAEFEQRIQNDEIEAEDLTLGAMNLLSKVKTYNKIWQQHRVTGEIVNAAAQHIFEFDDEMNAEHHHAHKRYFDLCSLL